MTSLLGKMVQNSTLSSPTLSTLSTLSSDIGNYGMSCHSVAWFMQVERRKELWLFGVLTDLVKEEQGFFSFEQGVSGCAAGE